MASRIAARTLVELTAASFRRKVLEGDGLWLVVFYAPWYAAPRELSLTQRHTSDTPRCKTGVRSARS